MTNTATGSKTASISIAVYFSRTWSEVQLILTAQAGMGSSVAETSYTFGSLAGTFKWYGGVFAHNGKIYGIPLNSTNILSIDRT